MTYTVVLFLTRHHALTPTQFRDHYETKHIPLAYSLLSHVWPITFERHYLARIRRPGFGSPANPDCPHLVLRGAADAAFDDYDCISQTTFDDEAHFLAFYRGVYAKETAALLTRDEANFLEDGKMRVLVVGETWSTNRQGVTTSEVGPGLLSDPLDSDHAASS